MPNYQGELDGLCGPYAIVNAFEHCGFEQEADTIFQTACKALSNRRWPSLLWEGTSFADLQKMIKHCRTVLDDTTGLKVSYPFSRNTPKNPAEYWIRFDELFAERSNVRCMILGITRPSDHWIVAYREGGTRISFVDADPHKPYQRKNRSMLHPGSRNGHPKKWIIERSELVLFEIES